MMRMIETNPIDPMDREARRRALLTMLELCITALDDSGYSRVAARVDLARADLAGEMGAKPEAKDICVH